jgi:hypothetical protein
MCAVHMPEALAGAVTQVAPLITTLGVYKAPEVASRSRGGRDAAPVATAAAPACRTFTVTNHPHPLKNLGVSGNWFCDSGLDCQSKKSGQNHKSRHRFQCAKGCDFDFCQACM